MKHASQLTFTDEKPQAVAIQQIGEAILNPEALGTSEDVGSARHKTSRKRGAALVSNEGEISVSASTIGREENVCTESKGDQKIRRRVRRNSWNDFLDEAS